MATNLQIITAALRDLNVISEIDTPSAEQGQHALTVLNQMIESWTEDDVELGYFEQTSVSDDIPIPKWAEKGVTAMLSIDLAPTYGASISAELAAKADRGYGTILRRTLSDQLVPADMDHMPRGDGHYGWNRYDIETDG